MATVNATALTLLDFMKRMNPNTQNVETEIAELLTNTNQILLDMLWKESNQATGHTLTIRTGYPSGIWRKFNQGVPSSKSTTVQVTETMGMYEQRGTIDLDLAMLNGNTAAFRMSENVPHMDSMNQDMATALFYADPSEPEKFVGLAPRYSSLTGAQNSQNILSAGGSSTDNTSIWLVGWGESSCFGIFPKGSQAGLKHKVIKDNTGDGAADVEDADGNSFRAYVDHYQWKAGLALKDWRYVVRIPNVDISDLHSLSGTQALSASTSIIKLMSRAIDRLPNTLGSQTQEGFRGVKPCFYVNRTVMSALKIIALEKSSSAVKIEDALLQFGGGNTVKVKELQFLGIPVRICDALLNTESAVS